MPSSTPNASVRLSDLIPPIVAGLISVIVNYGGTFILVFQAAKVAGLVSLSLGPARVARAASGMFEARD